MYFIKEEQDILEYADVFEVYITWNLSPPRVVILDCTIDMIQHVIFMFLFNFRKSAYQEESKLSHQHKISV